MPPPDGELKTSVAAGALATLRDLDDRFVRADPEGLRRALRKSVLRILEANRRIRPGFSQSWVVPVPPDDCEKLLEYQVGPARIELFSLRNDTEMLYQLTPFEYSLPQEHIRLIDSAREELLSSVPENVSVLRQEQARSHVLRLGTKLIVDQSQRSGILLGDTRAAHLRYCKKLGETLARYTAGFGIAEHMLADHHVQDIYIDAPAHLNPVYVTVGGFTNRAVRGKCRTNVCLGQHDAECLLSRFRYESGRPFSEARPFLECDLPGYNARATVIGRPLSPGGLAIALRRHSTDPWTLPRLIEAGSITPLAAGLISFLVDGQSTVLVAGSRGAGKTSLLGAVMLELPHSQRILTIEDTLELPGDAMRALGYKLQSMQVRSSLGGTTELTADDALRLALRLGESAIVMGEVRGAEARTLYEAMRAGTAGSCVLGTIHGNSATAVYERVVHDLGIHSRAFSATDIIIVAGLRRPLGSHHAQRRVTEIAELSKESDGHFTVLMAYDEKLDSLVETPDLALSRKLSSIAGSWGLTVVQALQNIRLRARVREELVNHARNTGEPSALGARAVSASNGALWELLERHGTDFSAVLEDWKKWFAMEKLRR